MPSPTDAAVALSPMQAKMALEVCTEWLDLFAATPGLEKYERYNYGPAVELLRDELADLIRNSAARAQAPAAGVTDTQRLEWIVSQIRLTDMFNITYPHNPATTDGFRPAIDAAMTGGLAGGGGE